MFLCWLPSRESGDVFGRDPGHWVSHRSEGWGSCAIKAPVPRCGLFTSCSRGWVGGPCSHWAPQLPAQNEDAEPRSSCSLAPLPSQVFLPGPLAGWGLPVCQGGEWELWMLVSSVLPSSQDPCPEAAYQALCYVPLSLVCADPQEGRGTQIPPALSTVEKMERKK